MRNLILTREKTFVGCAVKLKVYISDPNQNDLTIHNIPCRLLGTIKNDETLAFPIADAPARVFVIADKLSRNLSCEFCDLPAGSQDIGLRGKCRFDPYAGNPFHFEGNAVPAKAKRRSWFIGLTAAIVGVAIGLTATRFIPQLIRDKKMNEPQVFAAEGMQITLTKAFQEADVQEYGFTLGYSSQDTAVFVLKEEFSLSAGFADLTLDEYVQLVLENNGMSGGRPSNRDGLTIYEYTQRNPEDGETYGYMIVFFKGPDAFWMFEFSTLETKMDDLRQTYLDYAKTVGFDGAAI